MIGWISSLPVLPLFRSEFDALPEYSVTMPSGTIPGKRWRRHYGACNTAFLSAGGKPIWVIGEYDSKGSGTGKTIKINWYLPVPRIGDPPIVEDLVKLGCRAEPCGSRITCDPSPVDTDKDYLVEVPAQEVLVAGVVDMLGRAGFTWEGSEHYQVAASSDFMSWRDKDGLNNLIVTSNARFAKKHRLATSLCKRLNLLDKSDRIAVFQALLYGNEWNGETRAEMKAKGMSLTEAQAFAVTTPEIAF